ncbi:hypothetical protein B0T26DRAFT_738850 [Lasiosphaeria miniovina]|uniref:DNA 3'-5' helicase n=1 Tax=Lasiosphaeria miniovina TaxID=1954250 RepID=A0AA40B6D0_9PEZI|nr:uncharacterized protein B0T26DRAFT_738850 [Lasiosphaeria miniovina]KAK0728530.1 hypothetical protein B0T26DRAFT_738850 [Lasiosphaeria miniovina]
MMLPPSCNYVYETMLENEANVNNALKYYLSIGSRSADAVVAAGLADRNDTVLVAATGYGKSAVLYAFSAITKLTTIQIVPLTKLGKNQRDDIARAVASSKPVWIDSNTFLKNPNVWNEVKAGEYIHMLLSPEQAINPKFKAVLRDPDFHSKLGLFAIDELHMINEWREFREEFTHIYTLRALMPRRIPFFGSKVIRRYDADVSPTDQEIMFKDFPNRDTDRRIVLASVSLGMGMDIPDVERVIQFGIPPGQSLSDIWQRFRRAMRKCEGQGEAILFAPYYLFDQLGTLNKPLPKPRGRGRRQPHIPAIPSRLQNQLQLIERDDDAMSEAGSEASVTSQASDVSQAVIPEPVDEEFRGLFDYRERLKWSKPDIVAREKMDQNILGFLSATCFRDYILKYLQEPMEAPQLEYKRPVNKELCCNSCNQSLGRIAPLPPRQQGENKPQAGSFSGIALYKARGKKELPFTNWEGLVTKVPALNDWEHQDEHGEQLVMFCDEPESVDKIHEIWGAQKKKKADLRMASRASEASISPDASHQNAAPGGPKGSP